MAVNKITELAAVMNEAAREGKVLGFDTVSGDIRSYEIDQLIDSGSGGITGETVTAENTTTTRTVEEWMAEGLVLSDIATLKQVEGYRAGQIVHVVGYYSDTPGIGGGKFVWNSGSTFPEDDGTVFEVDGVTSGRWNRILSDPMVIRSEDFGLFNGAEVGINAATLIDSMRRACPEHGTVRFYKVDNPITTTKVRVDQRNLTFDLNDNTFIGLDNENVFELVGSVSNQSNVDFLNRVPFNNLGFDGDSAREVTEVVTPDAANFSVGDVVKIVSSDELPDLFNPNRRVGQFSTVADVTGSSVILYDLLFDHDEYQTDIKIATLDDYRMNVINGFFEPDPNADPLVEGGPSRVHLEMLKYPHLENLRGTNLERRLASLYSCFQFTMENCHVINSGNYPIGEGYVLDDVGCYGGYASNISSEHCRHVVTTNSRASTDPDDFNVGRGLHLTVVGGVGKFSYNHAFDTHPEAAYTTFIGCKAYQCDGAFQSRSPYTSFVSCHAYDCNAPFQCGTARENYANSFRHTSIKDCMAVNTNPDLNAYEGFLKITGENLTGINYGPVYVSGCDIQYRNESNTGLNALLDANIGNCKVYFNGTTVRLFDSASARLFKLEIDPESRLYLTGNTFVSESVAGPDFRIVQFTGTWPADPETEGTPVVYYANNTFVGPAEVDALVASSDAMFGGGNSVENVTAGFAARKFDGTTIVPGYSD